MNQSVKARAFLLVLILIASLSACQKKDGFIADFEDADRTWIGPQFWANRLQDWKLENGKLVCLNETNPMRTLHVLTNSLAERTGNFEVSVQLGLVEATEGKASAGILFGAGAGQDYRQAALIHHSYGKNGGLYAGVSTNGKLFIKDFETENTLLGEVEVDGLEFDKNLRLKIQSDEDNNLSVIVMSGGNELARLEGVAIPANRTVGSIALVSNPDTEAKEGRFTFDNWAISGTKVERHLTRTAGPVIGTQHTLHNDVLKMTAQLMPIGAEDAQELSLEIEEQGEWQNLQKSVVQMPGFTASFRIENWKKDQDTRYRIKYYLDENSYGPEISYYYGVIRKEPLDKDELVVAAFTGNHNNVRPNPKRWGGVDTGKFPWDWGLWFPHTDLIDNLKQHQPDVLFFSGDQVYEGASPTWADRQNGTLDYLYKWYLWYWAFGDLTAQIPTITIPDDHDVYHGNIWGAGGRKAAPGPYGGTAQDGGGYRMPAEWVKMVERTQTSHMPDPFDPTPVEQGIGVYYTDFTYGGVSFAVLEDRKFKSAPRGLLPEANVNNGWARNKDFDPKKSSDVPEAVLLGQRQLDFLESWAADWQQHTEMKAVLSQTIFADVVTLPRSEINDANFPGLEIYEKEGYAPDDVPAADMDSNGWPKTGRDEALKRMRKAFAVHIAGDQHLGSTIQYGVEGYRDAGFALCVPSIANFYPRRWFPGTPGKNREPDSPIYTGDHEDGFGNKMTVHAVSNPYISGKFPAELHDRAAGYGIARFNKAKREITFENWPRWADPSKGERPYEGWPVTFSQLENYGGAVGYLPEVHVTGMTDPVIQVYNQTKKEGVYTLRIKGNIFRPMVFSNTDVYSIAVFNRTGGDKGQLFNDLKTGSDEVIEVSF